MKKGRGKQIGGKWERDFCKFLSRWIDPDSKELYFWRSAGSGSVFTVSKGKIGANFAGDVCAIAEKGEFFCNLFSCELKCGYPNASLNNHLKSNKSDELKGFWEQCVMDAILSGKKPLLIFKKKGNHPWIGIDIDLFKKLKTKLLKKTLFVHLYWNEIEVDEEKYKEIFLFDMNHFFEIIQPNDIKKIKWKSILNL